MVIAGIPSIHPPSHQLTSLTVSQFPVVRSEHVRTLFDSTQSQESKSEVTVCNRMQNAAMHTMTHFKAHSVSLVSGVQSRCVRPFFASTESQESKSDMNIAPY